MSEAKLWLKGTDPIELLKLRHPERGHNSTQPQLRQSRLYLLACVRKRWLRLPPVCRLITGLAEEHADDPRGQAHLYGAVAPVAERLMSTAGEPDDFRAADLELRAAGIAADIERVTHGVSDPPWGPAFAPEEWAGVSRLLHMSLEPKTPAYAWVPAAMHDIELLRDVYGNPYRRVPFFPSWRTDTVVALARQMYNSREFSAMPILADALQDAECNNKEVLKYCRSGGPHARGCWVIDLVLSLK